MKSGWKVGLISAVALSAITMTRADVTPGAVPAGALKLERLMKLPNWGSVYNPRICNGEVFGVDIGAPYSIGRFLPEYATPNAGANTTADARMLSPMGGNSTTWVIAAGGSGNDYFSRFDYATMSERVFDSNLAIRPNAFDWVDENTVIASSYLSGNRHKLYLLDITADPFSVSLNTAWNTNGFVETPATVRIRNVTVGDTYNGYAYFGDAGVVEAKFFAIKLDTGVVTALGTKTVTGSGSWGLWTVKESGGHLYLHTTDDGIYVYSMTDATTLGSQVAHHTKAQIDALTGNTEPNYGFDVTDKGQQIIVGVGPTAIAEMTPVAPKPAMLWSKTLTAAHNIYYGGCVKNHQFHTGQIGWGPMAWDTEGNIVAETNITTVGLLGAKCAVPIGPYVFFTNQDGGFYRINDDWQTDLVTNVVNPGGTNPEACATDGTHLYANDDINRGVVHKYKIDNAVGSFTLTELWNSTTGLGRIRALSHHNGNIYAADYDGTNVVRIDTATGVSTTLFALPAGSKPHQVIRSGDRIFVVGRDDNLQIYATDGSNWNSVGAYNLGMGDLYGVSDVDDGNIWVTSANKTLSYWSLRSLPFTDDFESYSVDQSLSDLAYSGWSGSANAVVKADVGVDGSQAVLLPGVSAVTNTVAPSATLVKAWTDMRIKPVKGAMEYVVDLDASVKLYVNGDGYVVVYDPATETWDVCSNNLTGGSVSAIADDTYARITLYQNYEAGSVSIFVNDVLVRDGWAMLDGAPANYNSMTLQNRSERKGFLDNIRIATTYPVDLTCDVDGNGWNDALEIQEFGSVFAETNGVPYTWLALHGLTDPAGDADSDNMTNAEEYIAGTNPWDANSVFQILSVEHSGDFVTLTIAGNDSGASAPYIIQRCANLASGFESYDTVNRGAAPGNTVYVDVNPPVGTVFYRVDAHSVE